VFMTKRYNRKSEIDKRRNLRREQTYCEKLVWMFLRNRQMLGCKFRRQYSIDQYVVDFYHPKLKLAIEIDGGVHDLPEQKEYDAERQEDIEKFGITFVRITNEKLLGNPNRAFAKIEDAIKILERKKQSQPVSLCPPKVDKLTNPSMAERN
jgi:very-short-patch-repair endonuclease